MKPSLSIVVPVLNQSVHTQNLCGFLQRYSANLPGLELIIVDNASTDDTREVVERAKQWADYAILYMRTSHNLGYGTAANRGMQIAMADHIVVTNNDIVPAGEDMFCFVPGILGDRKVLGCARYLLGNGYAGYSYAEGWCLAFHQRFLDEVGGFREDFFLYFEDVELSYRALHNGYSIEPLPLSVRHIGTQSRGEIADPWAETHKSQAIFEAIHAGQDYAPRPMAGRLWKA